MKVNTEKRMVVYSHADINKDAGYKGCGKAFARIKDQRILKIIYADDLIDPLKDCDMSSENLDLLPSGIQKIETFAKDNPDFAMGMCICQEFIRDF